jgi:hypothetical protein
VEFPILGHASDAGFFGKSGGGLEDPVLDEVGFDILGTLGVLGDLRVRHGGRDTLANDTNLLIRKDSRENPLPNPRSWLFCFGKSAVLFKTFH